MTITVNDETRELEDGTCLEALLVELGQASKKGLAVAVNQSVVLAVNWPDCALADGDSVLLIQATQGG